MVDEIQTDGKRFQIVVGSLRDTKVDKNDTSVEVISRGSDGYKVSLFNQDVLEVTDALKKSGYETKALCKGEYEEDFGWFPWSPAFLERAKSLGADIEYISVPGGIGLMLGVGENPVFNWLHNTSERPRDAFVQLNGKIYLNPDYYPKKSVSKRDHRGFISRMRWLVPGEVRKIEKIKKEENELRDIPPDYKDKDKWNQYINECKEIWRKKEKIEKDADKLLTSILQVSPFGEGGRVIAFNDFIIASDVIQRKIKSSRSYRFQGRPVYFVKPIQARIGDVQVSPEDFRFHIDYHVNGLDLDGHAFLYVDPDFYEKNRGVFRRLEREQSVNISCVPKREQHLVPANFLVIPDRRILLPAGMPQSYRSLEQKLGSENVLATKKPLPNLLKEGYGVRCITNVVYY